MGSNEGFTVGALARLAGVTVRTLHHYDEIGLLSPGDRTEAGYRIYGSRQVERLQEVLLFRELGFGLDEIKQIIDEPAYRRDEALIRQKELLLAKTARLEAILESIDAALAAEKTGVVMSPEDMLEAFGDFDPSEHETEARERWGHTDAYAESALRTSRHTKQDWETIGRESDEINQAFLSLLQDGVPPDDARAIDLAERHRAHISKWFYECTPEIHAGLGKMYVTDRRFKDNIDQAGAGLAEYLSAAIAANAKRN